MTIKRKTNLTLLILAALSLFSVFLVINPIFSQIKEEAGNLAIQKKELLESEVKIKNLYDFKANFKQYQQNFEKIDELFINISEPIEFIEFLEREAATSLLFMEITPPLQINKNGDFGAALEFSLNLGGDFPNFLRFLERLKSSPYLIEPLNLSIRKINNSKSEISAVLLIKVYAK